VTTPPVDPRDRPDPNDCLNEVHIPVVNVQNPFHRAVPNHPVRGRQRTEHRQWKWVVTGVIIALGAWIVKSYFNRNANIGDKSKVLSKSIPSS
jgi:hypothetical protein